MFLYYFWVTSASFKLNALHHVYFVKGIGIVSAMEIIQEFSGQGIDKLKNLK